MNNERRNIIDDILSSLDEVEQQIQEVMDEEQDAFDNMPESLQDSERGEAMIAAVDNLTQAIDVLNPVRRYLQQAAQ